MSDPEAEPAAPAVKVYAMTVSVVEYILLKSRSVGPRTPVQTACGHENNKCYLAIICILFLKGWIWKVSEFFFHFAA